MRSAGVRVEDVGYVNAHGTGTRLNDAAEVKAYERAFAGRTAPVPVSSTKSYIGHTLGAAGAIEAVITLLALRTGTLFPTLRLERPIETRVRRPAEVQPPPVVDRRGDERVGRVRWQQREPGVPARQRRPGTDDGARDPAHGFCLGQHERAGPRAAGARWPGRASADRAVADRGPAPGLPRAGVSSYRLRARPAHPADGPAVGLGAARQRSRAPGRRHRCRGAGSKPHRRGLRNGLRVPRPDRGVPGRHRDERLAGPPHPVPGDAVEPAGQSRRASLRDHAVPTSR